MKKYFHPWRLIGCFVWLIALFLVPYLLIHFDLIPAGTAVYPMGVIFPLIAIVLFRRASIRIGAVLLTLLIFMNLYRFSFVDYFLDVLDHRLQSAFFQIRGPEKPSGDVVVLDIDHDSLRELGQWPWPRTYLSRAIENLSEDGVKVVGLDIVFPSEDHQSLKHFSEVLLKLGVHSDQESQAKISGEDLKRLVAEEYARANDLSSSSVDKALKHYRDTNLKSSLSDEEVLLLMGSGLHDLYYIDTDWRDPSIFTEGAMLILDNDQKLSDILSKHPVVGGGWIKFPLSVAGTAQKDRGPQAKPFEGMVLGSSHQYLKDYFPLMKKGHGQVLNAAVLQEGLNYQGAFNIIPEADGSARYYSLAIQAKYFMESLVFVSKDPNASRLDADNYEKQVVSEYFVYPSLALEMLRVGGGHNKIHGKKASGLYSIELIGGEKPITIPVTKHVEVPINFMGFGGKWEDYYHNSKEYFFPYYSFVDVLKGRFDKGAFKDKYVVIGSTDPTLSDLIGSPFRAGFPGLEVHATMLDNVLTSRLLADYDLIAREWKYFGFVLLGFILILILPRLGAMWGGVLSVAILVFLPVFAYYTMTIGDGRFVFSFSYEWFSILLLSVIVLLLGYFETSQDKKFLHDQFGSMVSPKVLAKLQADPKMQSLKGTKSDVTVVFSDIANFTTISESLSPQKLVKFLNKYFTPMTHIILEEQGYIDKFIGDAIMACWGVPFSQENHHVRACRAVVKQLHCINEMQKKLKKEFGYPLYVRFGIASGLVSSAMVGSEDRKNYTVLGDVVNTAARLEPLGKVYGVTCVVSHITYKVARKEFEFRKLDFVKPKGKLEPVWIYELMGEKGQVSKDALDVKNVYEEALATYQEREWEKSKNLLNSIAQDKAAINLLERVKNYENDPPPASWKGEIEYFQK